MAEPKCPDCGESGIDKIVSTPSAEQSREQRAWYYVAHCDNCGHVYGIFAKHVFGRSGPNLVIEGRKWKESRLKPESINVKGCRG